MPEYIEREAAIKFVEEQMKEINNRTGRFGSYTTEAYDMAIRHAVGFLRYVPTAYPKADMVEVVRCKDCKHYGANIKYRPPYYNFAFCYKFHHNITTDNDFCSYGERKGD